MRITSIYPHYTHLFLLLWFREKHSSLSFFNSLWTSRPKNPIHWRWRQPISTSTHVSVAEDPLRIQQQSKLLWRMLMSPQSSLHQLTSLKFMKMLLWTLWLAKWQHVTLIALLVQSGICLLSVVFAASQDKRRAFGAVLWWRAFHHFILSHCMDGVYIHTFIYSELQTMPRNRNFKVNQVIPALEKTRWRCKIASIL